MKNKTIIIFILFLATFVDCNSAKDPFQTNAEPIMESLASEAKLQASEADDPDSKTRPIDIDVLKIYLIENDYP